MALLSVPLPAPFCAGSRQHWAGKHESQQGGWAPPPAVPTGLNGSSFFFFFFCKWPTLPIPSHTDLCASHPVPCSCGMVHCGSESASWQVCMNLRLLHNCFVYSQPCDFSSRLSWIAICGPLACQLVFHYHSMFPPHSAQVIFFFISFIHVKHCENFIFTFWWNVWLFPVEKHLYPICC